MSLIFILDTQQPGQAEAAKDAIAALQAGRGHQRGARSRGPSGGDRRAHDAANGNERGISKARGPSCLAQDSSGPRGRAANVNPLLNPTLLHPTPPLRLCPRPRASTFFTPMAQTSKRTTDRHHENSSPNPDPQHGAVIGTEHGRAPCKRCDDININSDKHKLFVSAKYTIRQIFHR